MSEANIISLLFALVGILLGGISGPAFSWIIRPVDGGATMQEIRSAAGSGTKVPVRRERKLERTDGNQDDPLMIIAASFVVIVLYIKWRPWIVLGLASLSAVIGVAAFLVVFIAWWRNVIAGSRATVACIFFPFIYSAIGIVVAVLLWRAPGAPPAAQQALVLCSIEGSEIGLRGASYVLYAFLGGAFYVILALGTIYWDVAAVAAIYAAQHVWPHVLWRAISARLELPLGWRWPVAGSIASIFALGFSSGKFYAWFLMLQKML